MEMAHHNTLKERSTKRKVEFFDRLAAIGMHADNPSEVDKHCEGLDKVCHVSTNLEAYRVDGQVCDLIGELHEITVATMLKILQDMKERTSVDDHSPIPGVIQENGMIIVPEFRVKLRKKSRSRKRPGVYPP